MAESIIDITSRPTHEVIEESDPYLLIERSAGGIIRSTFRIYFRHFWTIISIAFIVLPFEVLSVLAEHSGHTGLYLAALVPSLLLGPFVPAALTIMIADLCLARIPSVGASYRRSVKLWPRLVATNLLAYLMLVLGLAMLLVPFVLFFIWYSLVSCIVVLEDSWGWSALHRSKALVRGYFWRTLGIWLALTMLLLMSVFVGGFIAGMLQVVMEVPPIAFTLFGRVMGLAVVQPALIVGLVLIYYDLRVRKEAYDSQTLASDLMH